MVLNWNSAKQLRQDVMKRLVILSAAAVMIPAAPVLAQSAPASTINLNPKRITFDRPGRSATVSVSGGATAGAFDVELVDRVMLPDGQIVPVSDAQGKPEVARLKSVKPYTVVTPRRIRVGAGAGQAIRLRVSPSAELMPGEYRSHLTVSGIPPADVGLTAEQAASRKEGELGFRINSVIALSIPVILRVGPVDVRAGIDGARVGYENRSRDGTSPPVRMAVLTLDLVRLGKNSLFGDLEVWGSKRGKEPIGAVRGIGVYPEIDRRHVRIPLTQNPASGDVIQIEFRDDDTSPGAILSKASVTAP